MDSQIKEHSIEVLQKLLTVKTKELEEAQKSNSKLENELTKLKKYNKDLISQIDLTNSKLHVLLGVCESKSDKAIQTDEDHSHGDDVKCQSCQVKITSALSKLSSIEIGDQDNNERLKAVDWARIAQEVVDSNDYIYEPTSKTYYSQSSGWYYYPNEKLFFDPNREKYYTYNQETLNYEEYSVKDNKSSSESAEEKRLKRAIKSDQESEEGEIDSTSESDSSPKRDYSSDEEETKNRPYLKEEDSSDSNDDLSVSCLRLIVRQSESLELGSLLLITVKGALIGNSQECDVIIADTSVSRKHAKFSFEPKKRCYQVVDYSSKNGVFLNGQRLGKTEKRDIKHGDVIKFGHSEFLLHYHSGKDVTCIGCEPGCVQASLGINLSKDQDNEPIIVEDRRTTLKKLKKRYGVDWEDENLVDIPESYKDRAKKRRGEKGSDNPYEKTGQGTCLEKPLDQGNKGFKMLTKLGWSKGKGIGKNLSGDTQPVPLLSIEGRTGLGFRS